jgi:hypothetical protein
MSLAVSGVGRRRRARTPVSDQRYLNMSQGINVFASEEFIADQEGSSGMNLGYVETGGITKTFGWEKVGSGLVNAPRGLASYYPTGLSNMLLTMDGNTLKYLSGSIWAGLPGITFAPSDRICFVQAEGKLFIHNSSNSSTVLTGLTLSRPATTVRAAFGIYYGDKQVVSGVREQPNRLYISDPNDVADFTNTNPTGTGKYSVYDTTTHPGATDFSGSGANYIDVAKDDGDKITALAKYQTQLIIFKERSIYSLEFDANGLPTISLVTNAIGCVSHWSVDSVDNDMIFASRKGYYVFGTQQNYFDQLRTNELSLKIRPFIKSIVPNNLPRTTSIWHDNVYYSAVTVGNSSTNNRVYSYYRQYTGWVPNDFIAANAFTEYIDVNNEENLYYAHETDPSVWMQTTGYDNGDNAIAMYWESKAFDFGQFDIEKRYVDVTLLFRQLSGSVKVTITIDGNQVTKSYNISGSSFSGGMGRALLGQALLGGPNETGVSPTATTTQNIPIRLDIGEQGRTIKVRVENATKGENFVLLGLDFGYRSYGRNNFPAELRVYA